MKSFNRLIINLLLLSISALSAYGQAFTKDDPIGTVIEYQNSDKNSSIERMTLVGKKNTPKGTEMSIALDDDKELILNMLQTDEELSFDIRSFVHFLEREIKAEGGPKARFSTKGDPITIPLRPKLYAQYPKINFDITVKILIFRPKVKFTITDREIVDTEVMDTPLGKHTAFVYKSRWNFNLRFAGFINESEAFEMYQWIVPGIGVVKEVTIEDGKAKDKGDAKVLVKKYLPEKK